MNSPLTTSVVGTSTVASPPNAPLMPASATTIARPAPRAMILRLLWRHMPLHRHPGLEAGRDNHFVIVHRAERDGARPGIVSIQHAHSESVFLAHDGIAGHHDDVLLALELDVDGRRQVGQQ